MPNRKIYLRLTKPLSQNFRHRWRVELNNNPEIARVGFETWVRYEDYIDDAPFYFPEDNKYSINFPRDYFTVIAKPEEESLSVAGVLFVVFLAIIAGIAGGSLIWAIAFGLVDTGLLS